MVIVREVITLMKEGGSKQRKLLFAMLLFSFFIGVIINPYKAFATPSAPELLETDWRTGELMVSWDNVTIGNAIILYTMDYTHPNVYTAFDSWTATSTTGFHIVRPFENGQTVFYYIVQVDSNDGTISPHSNEVKQTPPFTAYIINWDDFFAHYPVPETPPAPIDNTPLLQDIKDALGQVKDAIDGVGQGISDMNDNLTDKIDSIMKPSQSAIDGLNAAIEDAKNAVGAGQTAAIGADLANAIAGGQAGMVTPVNNDDGVHTFTGGANPSAQLPLDSGTDTPLTFRIPLTYDMNHQTIYMKIFTAEQLEKLQWLTLLRKAGTYTIWIIFCFWVVTRFTPAFKV